MPFRPLLCILLLVPLVASAQQSRLAPTAKGPIEYQLKGRGPVVLCLHGGPGGYDQSLLIGENLPGFTILGVSRPGYLQTPLSVGRTAEEQADAMIALLDYLGIRKVAVIGFSAGSTVAFQMAVRHPHRISACVLESTGAPASDQIEYDLLHFILKANLVPDFISRVLYRENHSHTARLEKLILAQDNDLSRSDRRSRTAYVLANTGQRQFLKQFIDTLTPLSLRREGLMNDISSFTETLNPWPIYRQKGQLRRLKIPTMIIQAKGDNLGDYQVATSIAAEIPGAKFVPVQQSGHFIWLGKNTQVWERELVRFLKSHH